MSSLRLGVIVALALATAGCGRPDPAPAAPPPTPTTGERPAPAADPAPTAEIRATDAGEAPAPQDPAVDALDPPAEAVADVGAAPVDAPEATITEDAAETPTPLAAPPTAVDQASCEAACAHALTIAEAELPPGATDETRGALREAMRGSCPKTCLEKASVESLQCIMKATTVLGLGACPD